MLTSHHFRDAADTTVSHILSKNLGKAQVRQLLGGLNIELSADESLSKPGVCTES